MLDARRRPRRRCSFDPRPARAGARQPRRQRARCDRRRRPARRSRPANVALDEDYVARTMPASQAGPHVDARGLATPAPAWTTRRSSAHLRAVLHDEGSRAKAPGSGSRPCTASSSRAAATSGSTPSPATAPTFRVYIPVATDAALVATSRAMRRAEARTQPAGETILLVEDHDAVLALSRQVLEGAGYDVVVARLGRGCAEVLARHSVDLVLTDLVMPGGTGERIANRGRARRAATDPLHVGLHRGCCRHATACSRRALRSSRSRSPRTRCSPRSPWRSKEALVAAAAGAARVATSGTGATFTARASPSTVSRSKETSVPAQRPTGTRRR